MTDISVLSDTIPGTGVTVRQLQEITLQAGRVILDIYHSNDHGICYKNDLSPVTRADIASHTLLHGALNKLTPDIPVLSEEGNPVPFKQRKKWHTLWLVDPLDGTREFIRGSGEFTVNIGLVLQNRPVFGLVYTPLSGIFYFGGTLTGGAWRHNKGQEPVPIRTATCPPGGTLRTAVSRFMSEQKMPEIFTKLHKSFDQVTLTERPGAIKGCLVAEGSVDFYPRPGATCEWDTAAFHAIITAAGGTVANWQGQELTYNAREELTNPEFFAAGDKNTGWTKLLH